MKTSYEKIIFLIAAISIFIRIFLIHPTFSDENFYFNAAKVFIGGSIPYKDFFFAHPPLQLFLYGMVFKIFGSTLTAAKAIPLAFSTLSFVLVFFIGRKIFDEKSALISSIAFLLFPAFFSFSLIGYGIFLTMSLLLVSILFYLNKKNLLAAIFFVVAIYVRYFAAPFILIFFVLDKKQFKKFLPFSFIFALILLFLFYIIFGFNFIDDTILFQISSKIGSPNIFSSLYWQFNFPLVVLSLVGITYGLWKKQNNLIIFSAIPLAVDIFMMLIFRAPFYYYFMISLPFYALSIGKLFSTSNDKILQILVFGILFFAIYNNISTIDFYLNPIHATSYYQMVNFISSNTGSSDKIIGDPSSVSYIAFSKNISVPLKYTDSFTQHILYEGTSDFISTLQSEKPKFFIETSNMNISYYFIFPDIKSYVQSHYTSVLNISGIPTYYIYQIKS